MKKRAKASYIWVVEMYEDFSFALYPTSLLTRWSPTVGIGLSRREGFEALAEWRSACPDDKFRLKKYQRLD